MTEPVCVATIIIPAHNEGRVIDRLLDGIIDGETPFALVVACNGCTDDTVARVRNRATTAHPSTIVVLDLSEASKNAAIRAAEQVATTFPWIVLDADVQVCASALRRVSEALPAERPAVARPPLVYDTHRASAPVRSFFRARSRTPQLMSAMWGAGLYGVSAAGRERWDELPDLVADDLFVDSQFSPSEKAIVGASPVVVSTPRTTRALVRTLRRVYGAPPQSRPPEQQHTSSVVTASTSTARSLLAHNRAGLPQWRDAAVYLALATAARLGRSRSSTWPRDTTTR